MRFPKERIRFTQVHEGHSSPDGFLVLDLKGLDIEGVTSLVLDASDVRSATDAGERQNDAARRLRDLLGE